MSNSFPNPVVVIPDWNDLNSWKQLFQQLPDLEDFHQEVQDSLDEEPYLGFEISDYKWATEHVINQWVEGEKPDKVADELLDGMGDRMFEAAQHDKMNWSY